MKIALLYICTGQYVKFWEEFYESFERSFLTEVRKEYFVFTDSEALYGETQNERIHRIFQKDLGWPGSTLFRFSMFWNIKEELEQFDYIFFMNANVVCMKEVTKEMFLPLQNDLLVVQHPFYYNRKPYEFTYERNKKSTAYIPYKEGRVYVCGGINGGRREAYLKLIADLKEQIEQDCDRGIIAKWHDESHLNKYILKHTNYRLLSPAFCYPEGVELPFDAVLMVSDKSKKIPLSADKLHGQKGIPFAGIRKRMIRLVMKWYFR